MTIKILLLPWKLFHVKGNIAGCCERVTQVITWIYVTMRREDVRHKFNDNSDQGLSQTKGILRC
jgi:hypothetical protein